jgi:hypothetical protein
MMWFGLVKAVMVLVAAGVVMTTFVSEADAAQRYCRKEYCAKKAPRTVGCSGLFCVPRIRGGQCLQTGVRLVKC